MRGTLCPGISKPTAITFVTTSTPSAARAVTKTSLSRGRLCCTRIFLSQPGPAHRFAPGRLRRRWQQRLVAPHSHRRRRVGVQVEPLAGMTNSQHGARPVAQRITDLVVIDVDGQTKTPPAQPKPQPRYAIRQLGIEHKLALVDPKAAETGDQCRPRSGQ